MKKQTFVLCLFCKLSELNNTYLGFFFAVKIHTMSKILKSMDYLIENAI